MELIFSMRRKPLKCEPPHFERRASDPEIVRPICTISCGNIIAFSSPTELTDTDCDTWGGHVYVCDLDTPWDSHKVVSSTHPISALEWNGEGNQLLVATTEGKVSVFGQKDYLVNEWILLYSTTFLGEHIIKASFFHNGRRFVMTDKKPDAPITEKIQALRCTPTLKGFGGVACAGACVVSATGLVGVLTPAPRGGGAVRASDSLRAHRDRVVSAAIAHSNGAMLIAAACVSHGDGCCVRCVRATVSGRCGRAAPAPPLALALALAPLPTLSCALPPVSISWSLREEADALLVAGRTLSLWKLTERQHTPHKMLVKGGSAAGNISDTFTTLAWQQTASWPIEGGSAVCVGSVRGPAGGSGALAVLAQNNSLHLVARESHHYVCSRAVATSGPEPAAASPPKKAKYAADRNGASPAIRGGAVVCSVEVSPLGGVLLCADTRAQLHAYRLLLPDAPSPLNVQLATGLLEYGLVTGIDCLDVLLAFKPALVEAVYERLTDTFQRHPAAFQQYYYHSWLKIRIALCRLIPSAVCSVSWLTCLQTLWGLWCCVQAALRPDDNTAQAIEDMDHDKALIALEAKADMWAESGALTALRRPLVRALDIAATALAAAADTSTSHRHHGYELWADPVGISLLRKLVIFARGAGLGDVALSRLLARLHQPAKPELIEECAAVSAAWGARVWEVHPRAALDVAPFAAPRGPAGALHLEYGVEPAWRWAPPPPPAAHSDGTPTAHMDTIRYMYLGTCGRWRQCARCAGRALAPPAPQRHPLQRAHDARFLPHCRCGGKWTLVSIV